MAEDTGRRGLELRNGGDILGGGAMIFARRDGLFSPETGICPGFLLPGLLIWPGGWCPRRGLGGFRSPEGEGMDRTCPDTSTRSGRWDVMGDWDDGDIAAESDAIRWCFVLTGIRDCVLSLSPAVGDGV